MMHPSFIVTSSRQGMVLMKYSSREQNRIECSTFLRQRGLLHAAIISKLSLVSLPYVVLFCLLPFCSKVPSYNLLSPLIFQTSSRCVSRHLEFFIVSYHLPALLICPDVPAYTVSAAFSQRSVSAALLPPVPLNDPAVSHTLPVLLARGQNRI